MINVSRVVNDALLVQNVDVIRSSASRNQYGELVSSTPTTISVKGIMISVSNRETIDVGLGEQQQEVRKLLSQEKLKLSESDGNADRVIWNGKQYKVVKVSDESDYGYIRNYLAFEKNIY